MKIRTPSRKTRKLVDQVFIPPRGWRMIKPTPLRRLWWKDKEKLTPNEIHPGPEAGPHPPRSGLMRFAEAVHFVEIGDYKISELRG